MEEMEEGEGKKVRTLLLHLLLIPDGFIDKSSDGFEAARGGNWAL